jgi:CRP-like cAMP-binding protein
VGNGDTIQMLRSARIFTGLSDEELAQVASIASEVEFPAGFVLTESGQVGSGMFVLLDGRVEALTPVRCLAISREPFRALIASDVHLAVALLENLADRVPD